MTKQPTSPPHWIDKPQASPPPPPKGGTLYDELKGRIESLERELREHKRYAALARGCVIAELATSPPEMNILGTCPECGTLAEELSRTETLLGYRAFADDQGTRHTHNPNRFTVYYVCKNGHAFTKEGHYTCWCGWSGDRKYCEEGALPDELKEQIEKTEPKTDRQNANFSNAVIKLREWAERFSRQIGRDDISRLEVDDWLHTAVAIIRGMNPECEQ